MSGENLYSSLVEIGLGNYLEKRGGGTTLQEDHMIKLDEFVKNLSDDQKKLLKEKINKKKDETHAQHNDMLHEISIACAFYDKVEFLPEMKNEKTPDFYADGIRVEVKTINNSVEEQERQDRLNCGPVGDIRSIPNKEEIKKEYIDCLNKKFTDHIRKAKKQLGLDGGHIWVVYTIDSPPGIDKSDREIIDKEIKNNFYEISAREQSGKFCIRYIYFELLREKIANLNKSNME